MRKARFKEIVAEGCDRAKLFMVVKIETEGNPGPETIVNGRENFVAKMAYYDKAYNDDMELIAAKNNGKSVRIADVLMTSNLGDLNWFAY
jgi:hypothetical protein